MGMSATAVKIPEAAAAAPSTTGAKPGTSAPSSLAGRRISGESGERLHGAHRKEHAAAKICETTKESTASATGAGGASAHTRDEGTLSTTGDETTGGSEARTKRSGGGNGTTPCFGADDRETQPAEPEERLHPHPHPYPQQQQQPSFSTENELTPERKATRRAGGTTRNRTGAATGASGIMSMSFRSETGRGGRKNAHSLTGERSFSGAAAAFSSVGGNAASRGSSGSGRFGKGSGAADAAVAVAATDEAGLAVAMMNILQSPESDGSRVSATAIASRGGGAGEGKQQAARRSASAAAASSLLLATNIVNTVGGGNGGAVTAPQNISRPLSSSTLVRSRTDSKMGRAEAATTPTENAASAAGAICGPGLVAASSDARRTAGGDSGMGGDWHLRASRAVGRARGEEEAGKATAVVTPAAKREEASVGPDTGETASDNTQRRSNSSSAGYGSAICGGIVSETVSEMSRPLRGCERTTSTRRTDRISDSDDDGGDDSDWSIGGGDGGGGGRKQLERNRERATAAAGAASRATAAPGQPAAQPRSAAAGKRKQPANKKTSEVSDNFVRADLKSRGSSRFKRKGSGRSKARGGSGGRSFGGGGRWGGRGGRGFGGGRFGGGGSKWGRGGYKGAEDPVTGEQGGAPRDRPLSSGAAKNRAGLDVLDQVTD